MNGRILANASNLDRSEKDFYSTPEEVTIALIDYLKIPIGTKILEPACGIGKMSDVFLKNGYMVKSSDLIDRSYGDVINFMYVDNCDFEWIITNPPFCESENFIKKCISFKKPFALLLKSQYWHSKKELKCSKNINLKKYLL